MANKNIIAAIIQARIGSTRLPGKVLSDIEGKPLIWHIIERLKKAKKINKIILATTERKEDKKLISIAKGSAIDFYAGNEKDVLDRFYQAAKENRVNVIVRITSDDPFKDPKIIDKFLGYFLKNKPDYLSNTIKPTYPEGLDIEIFTLKTAEKAWREAKKISEREHVTPYIWKNPQKFKIKNLTYKKDFSNLRWRIDYPEDLEFAREIYKRIYSKKKIFLMGDILKLLGKEPALEKINQGIKRNAGYLKSLREDKKI